MAKKPTTEQIRDFGSTLISLIDAGRISDRDYVKAYNMYESGLKSTREVLNDIGVKRGMSDAEYKMGTDLRGSKSIKDTAKAKGKDLPKKLKVGKKGGGKIYASMDKKYGGGIYPRKGKM